ncbi:MAG: phage distal tail protein, Rcc01695 family [Rhodomicrobiaceae bacterium]
MTFHEVRFPTAISFGSSGGPERRTEIVVLGSGHEERNTRWADSRRHFDAGYGVKSLDDLHEVISFFEERRGKLYGFRWKDHSDHRSSLPLQDITAQDQLIGNGDGVQSEFQLLKTYGETFAPYSREITKPVEGSVLVSIDSNLQIENTDYTIDHTTGIVTFLSGSIPTNGVIVTAGFEYDVPVRFDTDELKINLSRFNAGEIPNIPVVEVRI